MRDADFPSEFVCVLLPSIEYDREDLEIGRMLKKARFGLFWSPFRRFPLLKCSVWKRSREESQLKLLWRKRGLRVLRVLRIVRGLTETVVSASC